MDIFENAVRFVFRNNIWNDREEKRIGRKTPIEARKFSNA